MWVIFVRWSAKVEEEKGGRGRGEEGRKSGERKIEEEEGRRG